LKELVRMVCRLDGQEWEAQEKSSLLGSLNAMDFCSHL
jgi:hypothetical protein